MVATITVGLHPEGVAVTPDGSKVYVANVNDDHVSVIDTTTNTVSATIPVANGPVAFGIFIQPKQPFTGKPSSPNCIGTSVSALSNQFGTLTAAANAFGESVTACNSPLQSLAPNC